MLLLPNFFAAICAYVGACTVRQSMASVRIVEVRQFENVINRIAVIQGMDVSMARAPGDNCGWNVRVLRYGQVTRRLRVPARRRQELRNALGEAPRARVKKRLK